MDINEVQAEIKRLSGNNVEFAESTIPNAAPIMGVRLPDLRKIAKAAAKGDYEKFLAENPMDTFELQTIQAFVIGYAKDDIGKLLAHLEEFIPRVHDWSVSDSLCQNFKISEKYPAETYAVLMKYKDSEEEFPVRIVAIMLMSHFLNDEYIERVITVLNELKTNAYYSRMGVAWAVATIMAKYPDRCLEYLRSEDNRLDDWTFNKAIQKIKESYRVSDEMKKTVTALKRKG